MVRYLVQMAMLLAVAGYAWRRGGWPEQAVAGLLVAIVVVDRLFHWLVVSPQYRQLDLWHLSLDLVMLAVVAVIALRAARVWPLWIASLQVISTLGHFLNAIGATMPLQVYWVMTTAPSYLQIFLLAMGTWLNDPRTLAKPPI